MKQVGNSRFVKYLIVKEIVDIDIKGEYERTSIHYAYERGHHPVVKYLISKTVLSTPNINHEIYFIHIE